MYGLTPETDFSFLKDATLVQVAIGENEVILRFYPQCSIMIASSVSIYAPGEPEALLEDARQIGISLLPILGTDIAGASAIPPGTLRLTWRSGHTLDVLDSWRDYESYTVTTGDRVIVV